MSTVQSDITLKVSIPEDILKEYEQESVHRSKSVDQLLRDRLIMYASAPSEKPIILSDSQRRLIEQALKKNLNTPADLVDSVTRLTSINVAGVEVRLGANLADRLSSRAIGMEQNKFIESTVRRLLEEFVGLR